MAKTEPLPLAGKRVVVTRGAEQARELVAALAELGAEVLLLPAVEFGDPADPAPLDRAIRSLDSMDWLIFTSQNAVRFFAKRCRALGLPATQDPKLQIAAVGPATASAAEQESFQVDWVAREFRGEALAAELGGRLAGKKVLLPRSDRAAEDLPALLRAKGAEVLDVVAYRTLAPEPQDSDAADRVRRGDADVLTFFSPSAFHHITEMIGLEVMQRFAERGALAAIGPVTARAIREAGLPVEIEAPEATTASLVAAIARYYDERLPSGVKLP